VCSLGEPYLAAYALLRAARAAATGDRGAAAGLADGLAAQPLRLQIGQLARRARVQVAGPVSDQPEVPLG
jgi:hypothetical protein